MKSALVLGIMSGTSLDGVDYALCQVSQRSVTLEEHWQVQYPKELRQRLNRAARGICSSYETGQLHHDLGRFYARHAARGSGMRKPVLVGLHGQTVFHNPQERNRATLQIGQASYLADALGVPVVSDFRSGDVAAGGQGAPLATLFHWLVFGKRGSHICVNNLGGISNVTSIDWKRGRACIHAFDTGPANVLLDLAMQHYTAGRKLFDKGGAWARRGTISEPLVMRWLEHPYFAQSPPKSTGRELFGERYLAPVLARAVKKQLSKYDVLATLTELTAQSLATNYHLHLPSPPERLILTGGGAANAFLVERIAAQFRARSGPTKVTTSEETGWPLQTIEPAAFALLAYRRVNGLPGNVPETTGARRPVLLGQITDLDPGQFKDCW